MDFAGGIVGTLGATYAALSDPAGGAITTTTQIPAPVDYQFMGGGAEPLNLRARSILEAAVRADRRRR